MMAFNDVKDINMETILKSRNFLEENIRKNLKSIV